MWVCWGQYKTQTTTEGRGQGCQHCWSSETYLGLKNVHITFNKSVNTFFPLLTQFSIPERRALMSPWTQVLLHFTPLQQYQANSGKKSFLHPGNTLQMLETHPALGTYIHFLPNKCFLYFFMEPPKGHAKSFFRTTFALPHYMFLQWFLCYLTVLLSSLAVVFSFCSFRATVSSINHIHFSLLWSHCSGWEFTYPPELLFSVRVSLGSVGRADRPAVCCCLARWNEMLTS